MPLSALQRKLHRLAVTIVPQMFVFFLFLALQFNRQLSRFRCLSTSTFHKQKQSLFVTVAQHDNEVTLPKKKSNTFFHDDGLSISTSFKSFLVDFHIESKGNRWLPGGGQINLKVIVYFGKQSAGTQNIGDLYLMG